MEWLTAPGLPWWPSVPWWLIAIGVFLLGALCGLWLRRRRRWKVERYALKTESGSS